MDRLPPCFGTHSCGDKNTKCFHQWHWRNNCVFVHHNCPKRTCGTHIFHVCYFHYNLSFFEWSFTLQSFMEIVLCMPHNVFVLIISAKIIMFFYWSMWKTSIIHTQYLPLMHENNLIFWPEPHLIPSFLYDEFSKREGTNKVPPSQPSFLVYGCLNKPTF